MQVPPTGFDSEDRIRHRECLWFPASVGEPAVCNGFVVAIHDLRHGLLDSFLEHAVFTKPNPILVASDARLLAALALAKIGRVIFRIEHLVTGIAHVGSFNDLRSAKVFCATPLPAPGPFAPGSPMSEDAVTCRSPYCRA